ncbi:GGDEF domain-containing protein [Skermania sp. ID1734]|uniref:GGDEF domain-containing protein n=1 Tax=Skermania sp. ID1734 TaxID=2597516 RepID=UPI001180B540|nr:GGDEF domain-containing protein [Skermania sp. ID1734]TSE00382.1 GGDEF domain-containing protein [Skermania sp. ID1734]
MVRAVLTLIRQWWTEPIDPAWFRNYLETRSLGIIVRILIGVCTGLIVAVAVAAQFSPAGPHGILARSVSTAVSAAGLLWMLRWFCGPWPSAWLSRAFVVFADAAIVAACLVDTNSISAMAGLSLLAIPGTYVILFHSPRMLVAHLVWSFAAVGVIAYRMAFIDSDLALAAAKTLVFVVAVGVVPVLVSFGFWMIRADAAESMLDPMTKLANRRGIETGIVRIVSARSDDRFVQNLALVSIDLDKFKQINDLYGHAVGDDVLIRTGARISEVVRANTVVGRLGGEEFVVIAEIQPADVPAFAQRISAAICRADDVPPVTASLGVAMIQLVGYLGGPDTREVADRILARADAAMYRAKRAGGNRIEIEGSVETFVSGNSRRRVDPLGRDIRSTA